MNIYLIQHGLALTEDIDPQRPLSERGREDITRLAVFLQTLGLEVKTIFHSGKKRAEQTAELLADKIIPGQSIRARSDINPNDSLDSLLNDIHNWTEDVLLVGHLPYLGKLVSRLVVGDEAKNIVTFNPGTAVCLKNVDKTSWQITWTLPPTLLID